MGDLFQPWHLIILFGVASTIFPLKVPTYWLIFKKAGVEPALSILTMIPLVNIILLYYVALSERRTVSGNVSLNPGPTLP